jgi:crotonobetainyl-CoA:carnitine CoA-transferase CaiB-like acyl-CoA transferase
VEYRGYEFEVPEFPRLGADSDGVQTLPPPELGTHTLEVLQSVGVTPQECDALVQSGAALVADGSTFPWAPVR